jgi:hypothetical protein
MIVCLWLESDYKREDERKHADESTEVSISKQSHEKAFSIRQILGMARRNVDASMKCSFYAKRVSLILYLQLSVSMSVYSSVLDLNPSSFLFSSVLDFSCLSFLASSAAARIFLSSQNFSVAALASRCFFLAIGSSLRS